MRVKINKATGSIKKWIDFMAKGEFQPIIKVWSGPKGTRRHFFRGVKAGRNHHFLSDGEYRAGIYYESLPHIIDYFEQFPLWDIERAIKIANEMGGKYPQDSDGEAYIMSTDLLCREYDPIQRKVIQIARSYKPMDSLDFKSKHPISVHRTLFKLELERRYYEELGILYRLITDAHISKICAHNLKAHRESAKYKNEFIEHEERFLYEFVNLCLANESDEVKVNLEKLTSKLMLSYSDLYALFQWGIWTHQIPANLEVKINPYRPLILKEVT